MKLTDLIALISFALAGVLVLKAGLKRFVLILVSIGMLCLLLSILSRVERRPVPKVHRPSETPAPQQALSDEAMTKLLKEKSASGKAEWDKAYPHGYILFGGGREKVLYESQLNNADVQMDFDRVEVAIDNKKQIILIRLPNIVINYSDGGQPLEYDGNLERLRFVDRQPVKSMQSPKVYFEVVDTGNRMFLMGLK